MPIDLARALAITGWMSPTELRWLAEHALTAHTIVEIGSFHGRSARALADHCPGTVYAIDLWEGYSNDDGSQAKWMAEAGGGNWTRIVETFQKNLSDHLATDRVIALRYPSADARAILRDDCHVSRADLVFIDGDHRYEACRQDIDLYRDLVRPGGILAGHDYSHKSWPGVKRAVDERLGKVNHCDSIWWVRR
jgi:predicted O-methyltransferase YrrM